MIHWRESSFSNGASACVEVGRWVTSSYSQGNGNCVAAMGLEDGGVAVRDTKLGEASPVLRFNADEWAAFLAGVRNNEFDA
jgi:hypothetical protein